MSGRSRSYAQYCGLARALDVVGDRWTLLIVRELLGGPSRYGALTAALPGIATNLLSDRLRTLVGAGVAERRWDPAGQTAVYALTAWGEQLRDPIEGLVRWSEPLMRRGPDGDQFRPQWLLIALAALLRGRPAGATATVGLEVAGVCLGVRVDGQGPHVTVDPDPVPPTVLRADPEVILGLAAGALTVGQAVGRGHLTGELEPLIDVFASRPTT